MHALHLLKFIVFYIKDDSLYSYTFILNYFVCKLIIESIKIQQLMIICHKDMTRRLNLQCLIIKGGLNSILGQISPLPISFIRFHF